MAEEFRHAGIGIDLNIKGLQDLMRVNAEVDKVINRFKLVGENADKADASIDKMASNSSKKLDNLSSDFKQVSNANTELINKVKDVQQSITNLRAENIQRLNQSFKNTSTSADNTMKAIGNVKRIANEVSSEHMTKLGNSTKSTGHEAEETEHKFKRFRDTALGVFAGSALQNGISNVTSGLKDALKQGLEFNAAADDMQKKWTQAGLSSGQANAMTKQIGEIRQHADISAQSIANMQRQYLTLTGSAEQARDITSTITSFGTASGLDEQKQNSIARLVSSNKTVNARMFQRTLGQSPQFANEIIKQTGMSKEAFNNLLQSGKLTGAQLREAMIKASKDSNVAWSDYAQTATGKMALVKATIANSKKAFDTNLTGSMFDQINKAAGNAGGLNKLQKKVEQVSKDVGKAIGNILGGAVGFLAKNIGPLEKMASAVWTIVKALAQGAWQTVTAPLKLIAGDSKKGSKGLNNVAKALTAIGKHQTMLKVMGGLIVGLFATVKMAQGIMFLNNTVKAYKELKTAIVESTIAEKASNAVKKVAAGIQWALNAAMDANPIGIIIVAVTALVAALYELYKHFKPFRKLVNGVFKAIGKAIGGWWKQTKKNFAAVQKIIGIFAKFFKKYFGNVIKDGVKNAKQAFKVIGDVIRVFKDVFTLNFKDLGKVIPKLVGDLWKLVKGIFKEGAEFVEDIGSNMWKAIWNTFKGWGKAIGNFFKDLWSDISGFVKSGINDVIDVINLGIKGVDWVLSKVGGNGHTISPIKHLATGTTGGKLDRHTLAMLNDGNDSPQTGNKEMAILPNGKAFIPQKRNWMGILPKGTMVLNATQTRELMGLHGIQHFAGGSLVGSVVNGAKSLFGGVVNGAKKVANAIAHPIKFIKGLFHGVSGMSDFVSQFTGGLATKAADVMVDFFKHNSDSGADNPGGSGVQRWRKIIEQAASFMGQNLSGRDINLVLSRIARESGGNPTIKQQVSDVNSAAGHPAQGLLQYVPSTFASWAVKGHTNLLNGFDQLLAMFNDSNWRSDIANNGGWGPTGHRARKTGGPVSRGQWYKVNEEGQELFKPSVDGQVVNHNDSKRIINGANKPINIKTTMNVTINGNADSKGIEKKLHDSYEEHTRMIAEKLSQSFGANEGGYYPI
ncbi:hypothetical protein ERK14_06575 [Lactobacillus kunkeei]|nr:hypothetical protein [Apilactobacillus kunkeei]